MSILWFLTTTALYDLQKKKHIGSVVMKSIRGVVHATASDFGPTYFLTVSDLNIGKYGFAHEAMEKSLC